MTFQVGSKVMVWGKSPTQSDWVEEMNALIGDKKIYIIRSFFDLARTKVHLLDNMYAFNIDSLELTEDEQQPPPVPIREGVLRGATGRIVDDVNVALGAPIDNPSNNIFEDIMNNTGVANAISSHWQWSRPIPITGRTYTN